MTTLDVGGVEWLMGVGCEFSESWTSVHCVEFLVCMTMS